jgi:hypothetical protein
MTMFLGRGGPREGRICKKWVSDWGSDSHEQTLAATCGCLRCKDGSGAIGWRGIGLVVASTYSSSSTSAGGGPMLDGPPCG